MIWTRIDEYARAVSGIILHRLARVKQTQCFAAPKARFILVRCTAIQVFAMLRLRFGLAVFVNVSAMKIAVDRTLVVRVPFGVLYVGLTRQRLALRKLAMRSSQAR